MYSNSAWQQALERKEIKWACLFRFFCLCPLGLIVKLNINTSTVAYSLPSRCRGKCFPVGPHLGDSMVSWISPLEVFEDTYWEILTLICILFRRIPGTKSMNNAQNKLSRKKFFVNHFIDEKSDINLYSSTDFCNLKSLQQPLHFCPFCTFQAYSGNVPSNLAGISFVLVVWIPDLEDQKHWSNIIHTVPFPPRIVPIHSNKLSPAGHAETTFVGFFKKKTQTWLRHK